MSLTRHQGLILVLATCGLLWLGAGNTLAFQDAEPAPVTVEVKAGFDGYYKGEFWVPVRVTVANQGPLIEGAVIINTGSSATQNNVVYRSPIVLPTQSNKEVRLNVFLPEFTRLLTVELVDESGRIITTADSNELDRLTLDNLLFGVLSPVVDELEELENAAGGRGDAAVAFLGARDLPELEVAWSGLDFLFIHNSDSGRLSNVQLEALEAWIETGGQLIVTGGPEWQKTTSGVRELLPVEPTGLVQIQELPSLEAVAEIDFRDPGPYLVTESRLLEGELLIHQDGLPILARRDMGRGAVYFLALDPDLAPLADWDGAEVLWSDIASRVRALPTWALGAKNSYSAETAISSLPSVALPSATLLFAFLFIYVLAVGPVNYLALKRMGRRELAWFTIPALIILFSGAAYLVGFRLKGNEVIVNQMSIVFGQAGDNRARVQTLIGLYSPRRSSYDLSLPGSSAARPFDPSFGILAGSGNFDGVEQENETTLRGVRVDVGGIETFVVDTIRDPLPISGRALLSIDNNNLMVELNIENKSDQTFENAVLLIGRSVVPVGDMRPGEVKEVNKLISMGELPGVAEAPSSFSTGSAPVSIPGSSGSLLSGYYGDLLGTPDYYTDPEVFGRWQLLQAIIPDFGAAPNVIPQGTATLIGWTSEQQLEISVEDQDVRTEATSLYFIEMPVSHAEVSGQGIIIPEPLIEWQVLGQSGVYNPQVTDLYLPHGWVEFEYQPWSEFHDFSATDLALSLEGATSDSEQPLPWIQMWDWREQAWITINDITWGRTEIEASQRYVGLKNNVRVRLQNDGNVGIDIRKIYPEIKGDSD